MSLQRAAFLDSFILMSIENSCSVELSMNSFYKLGASFGLLKTQMKY